MREKLIKIEEREVSSIPSLFTTLKSLGFTTIYDESFPGDSYKERCYILFNHAKSILFIFDTYTCDDEEVYINSSRMYFNWVCTDRDNIDAAQGLVEFREIDGEFVWSGELTGIDQYGLREAIDTLSNAGKFLDWKIMPNVSLLNESEDIRDIKALNEYKLDRFPSSVLKKMGILVR